MKKHIIFLSDTPPLRYKGSGISVLLYNILLALKPTTTLGLITFCEVENLTPSEIEDDNKGINVIVCDSGFSKLYKLVQYGILKSMLQAIGFMLSLPRILATSRGADSMYITVIGSSAKPLWKFLVLKLLDRKAKHGLYIVDDLEVINRTLRRKLEIYFIKLFLKPSILGSDFLICISEGLRMKYKVKYNRDSFILYPHFKKVKMLSKRTGSTKAFSFLFSGGLNFLYNESLILISSVIDEINSTTDSDMQVKLIVQTYSSKKCFDELKLSSSVLYSTCESRQEILKVYEECDCFLIPYSFSNELEPMVTTSFPQKLAELIQYGRRIAVFGPSHSSITEFFIQNQLSHVIDTTNRDVVKKELLNIVHAYKSDTSNYTAAYEKFLSAEAVVSTFEKVEEKLVGGMQDNTDYFQKG